ncbi:ribosome recycling factor [Marinoscillum furvescens]|uniref:Ribosome-recycling factor n=1 Tax=Marinoscillum furvescens DSM 4134 TaxID=1122208 RepID=A0A3D9L393_MARFU|nr:ribosome recycling factor [Marinoscillum furvescens]RED99513.1 ribosome recycling factor [Marinoscillum furvescens DSM 4134]
MEDIDFYLEHAQELMDKAISHTNAELAKIRAGKAMPSMLDGVEVEYYGAMTPLNQVASVSTPDARTISVKPFEKKIIPDVERAIINANLGLNPQNDGELIRINIPPLTEERRLGLVKQAKAETENGKISVRNARKEVMDALKKLLKDGAPEDAIKGAEEEVQKITDEHTKKLDALLETKEKDIMTI